jgi:hypothetical protein
MGGIMMPPPPPMNTTLPPVREVREEPDDVSDIVSISGESTGGELRDVSLKPKRGGGGGRKKKNEVSL